MKEPVTQTAEQIVQQELDRIEPKTMRSQQDYVDYESDNEK